MNTKQIYDTELEIFKIVADNSSNKPTDPSEEKEEDEIETSFDLIQAKDLARIGIPFATLKEMTIGEILEFEKELKNEGKI